MKRVTSQREKVMQIPPWLAGDGQPEYQPDWQSVKDCTPMAELPRKTSIWYAKKALFAASLLAPKG
ncbi:hypothetical protein [Terrimicrobium sacchariphilum]|uniref:hypothetical protein n=1 Tax=Terrimicrobium sacchariphilum TaxID=690879 RepID=UPI00129BA6E1|nr:hypothetical protein [Terrimicrobium sacchariphilum]